MKFAKVTDTHYGFNHKTHKIHMKLLKELAHLCEKEKVEGLIHCGDWATTKQNEVQRSWKMFREYLGDLPIYTVMGNHCHWDYPTYGVHISKRKDWKNGKPYGAMESDWEQWAGEYDISLMENHGPVVIPEKNIAIYGFNGWYDQIPPNTNDSAYMPKSHHGAPIDQFLRWKAQKKLDEWMEHAAEVKIRYPGIKCLLMTHHGSYNFEKQWEFMSANLRWMEFIAQEFDYYCCGHSHKQSDFIYKSPDGYHMRCINAGSCDIKVKQLGHRYNAPVIKIFDTEDQFDLSKVLSL